MNPRSTLILAGVAALLAAFIYFYEIRGAEERDAAADAENAIFPGVAAEDVDAIELVPEEGEAIRLEREEGAWQVVAPVRFPADAVTADGLASGLAELHAERVFDEHEPLSAYGLEGEPTVHFEVGEERFALRVGDEAPVGSETYVTDASAERVFAVPTFKTTGFARPLDELRDKQVLDFDRDAATGLEVGFETGRVTLEKRDGSWHLTAPLETPADEDTVDRLLADLAFLRAASFHDDEAGAAELGLDAPWYEVAIETGAEGPVTLAVGREDEDGQRIVSGRAGPRYRVASTAFADWPRTVASFRDRQVASFASVDVASFELAFQGEGPDATGTVRVARSDQGWEATPEPLAPGRASGILAALADLEAADIAADEMGPDELAALGLSPPRVVITVHGEEAGDGDAASELAAIELGALQEGRGVPARRAGGDIVFWLDASIADTVPLDLASYRADFAASDAEDDTDGAAGDADDAGSPSGADDAPPPTGR